MSTSPKADARCPMCRHVAHRDFAPFCSARCRDRDLLNWLGEAYAVPDRDNALDSD